MIPERHPMRTLSRSLFVWMLALETGSAACSSDRGSEGSTKTTEAVPPDSLRSCQADDDCVKVGTSCNGCCKEAVVNVVSSAAYSGYRMNVCAGYSGAICDCVAQASRVVCRQQKCALENTDGG
jgi:hypothetical protein